MADDDHLAGHRLDLVEHVAGDEHAAALVAELADELDQVGAGDRVGAAQRLVEEDERRVVGDRLGDLRPLPHAAAHLPHALAGVGLHADAAERPRRPLARLDGAKALEAGEGGDEVEAAHVLVEAILLGAEAEVAEDLGALEGIAAPEPDIAGVGPELAGDQLDHRRLAGAVRAEEADHPGVELEVELVEGAHLAEELADAA